MTCIAGCCGHVNLCQRSIRYHAKSNIKLTALEARSFASCRFRQSKTQKPNEFRKSQVKSQKSYADLAEVVLRITVGMRNKSDSLYALDIMLISIFNVLRKSFVV